jgi:hypothetical protein
MRALLPALALLSAFSTVQAEEAKPARVIAITRENAEASAALIKSPPVAAPPMGRVVRRDDPPQQAAQLKSWKDVRAEETGSVERRPPPRERSLKRVEIWKPTASGGYAVQAYTVPATDAMAHGH